MSVDVSLQVLTQKDIHIVRQLHDALLPISYPPSFFRHMLLHQNRICLVALTNDFVPIGFVSAHRIVTPSIPQPLVHILTLGVLPSHRLHGLGRILILSAVRSLVSAAASVTASSPMTTELSVHLQVEVSTSNTDALRFYESLGLHPMGSKRNAYHNSSTRQSSDALRLVGNIAASGLPKTTLRVCIDPPSPWDKIQVQSIKTNANSAP